MSKKIVFLTAEGFEDEELIYPALRLAEVGYTVTVAIKDKKLVKGRFGFPLEYLINNHARLIDTKELVNEEFDAVIIPGGFEAPDRVRQDEAALQFVRTMCAAKKTVAAFCHGPWVLISAGVIAGKKATCYKGMAIDLKNAGALYVDEAVVIDENIITSRHPRDMGVFMPAVLAALSR